MAADELSPLTHPLDPWRAAKLMIDQFGPEHALTRAEDRLFELSEAGDEDGAAVWQTIIDAIVELRRTVPRDGEARH